ncbi:MULTISPECIES: hypothetical protein [Elizabethkingia]|uniref:hypothetical protein n=1 Tax=Elizabethkingia TaxID=308865 RepID=UPI0002ABB103|nr:MULTISPECIES: hypothetical protein [Elizabethkingia]ELR81104.1 hypothetical protein D505_01050 [Elizabethkingia anophelis R26]MCP1251421.1 hypothetical protein [Elizabethkingia sp. S0634]MCS7369700.1 hypothetical protein [Elizabethkingia anophelis]MCS7374976.1 hypothetical protein [Elizabethkingia anophelis]MCS7387326.1 hypothetical protein [Elizabethkingia anophelis]
MAKKKDDESILKIFRERYFKIKDLPPSVISQWQVHYLDKNFEKNKFFRLALFLRKKGANLNHFFDTYIEENKETKSEKNT